MHVGIIGCGMISRFHFNGLEKVGATIGWVCDLKAENAAPWVAKTGARYTSDWHAIIADPAVDTVVVATISRTHKEICLAAIAAGKAVICEKTLSCSAEDSWEIVSRAEAAGTPFFTSYMKRWFEAAEQAKRLLPSLGRIVTTHARVHQPWGDVWKDTTPPRAPGSEAIIREPSLFVSNYGGGILVMGGSHLLDLLLFLFGRPQRLFAYQYTPGNRDIDLQACALMETADHGVIHYEALASPLSRVGFLRDGWDEQIEITGTGGRLTLLTSLWNHVEQKTALLIHDDEATGQRHEYRFAINSPFDRAIAAFASDITARRQTVQSRQTGYEVDQLIATISASAACGQPLSVPWKT